MNSKYPFISIFKYTVILIFSLLKSAELFSQNSEVKITLQVKDESPLTVFKNIESQSDFHFIYDEQSIDSLKQQITIECDKESLDNVLKKLKKQTNLRFRVYNKYIAVAIKKERITISGFVTDSLTGEYLIGAVVFMLGSNVGATTNAYGHYSLNIPGESATIKSRFLGYESELKTIDKNEDFTLNLKLTPQKTMLREVLVSTTNLQDTINDNVDGVSTIGVKDIPSLPMTYSEPDIVKSTYYLPGVSRLNQGNSGYSVRGSASSGNIILLDNCPLYNISHNLVDLSIFNPDVIQNMSLYKGGIPAEYGGGAASVLNIISRNGDKRHFHLHGGISTVATRLSVEGPIIKNKLSCLISLRRGNIDWLKWFNSKLHKCDFYDINAKFHYRINDKQQLALTIYKGKDDAQYKSDSDNHYQNWANLSIVYNWNYIIHPKLTMNTSNFFSKYEVDWRNDYTSYGMTHGQIKDIGFKQGYNWKMNSKNTLNFGWNCILHIFDAYDTYTEGEYSTWTYTFVNNEGSYTYYSYNWYSSDAANLETIAYADHNYKMNNKFNIHYGLRWDYYYDENFIDDEYSDGSFGVDRMYMNPRMALSYQLHSNNSLKASYNHITQNLHQASYLGESNSTYFIWIPSFSSLKPISSNQISLGYYHNTKASDLAFSTEIYYKYSKNNLSYFSDSVMNNKPLSMLNNLIISDEKSYGIELFLRVTKNKLKGNLSYTLSRSLRQANEINNGSWYSSNYDRPLHLALNMNYLLSSKFHLTLNWLYYSGMPTSISYEDLKNNNIEFNIDNVNNNRLPDYHRLDIGLAYENTKSQHRFHSTCSLNLYNVYDRDNMYINEGVNQYSSSSNNNTTMFQDYGIMPTISYNFKF